MLRRWIFTVLISLALWLVGQALLPAVVPVPCPGYSAPGAVLPLATGNPATLAPSPPCCTVRFHPEEQLYVGDQVSFEVIAPSTTPYLNQPLTVTLSAPPTLIGSANFQPYGFDRRTQATLLWAWDTRTLAPGEYSLHFSIPSLGQQWTQTVRLLPHTQMPLAERTARWQTVSSGCCRIHFVTNTAAHRDLEVLVEAAEREYQAVQAYIPTPPEEPLEIVFIPRLLGNGGFANAEVNVSYLDRNYTAGDFATILRHEIVHVLDQQAQPEPRPSLFVEGMAVYLSGGHYFAEALLLRAAALLPLHKYVPLQALATAFYDHPHEIAYLEAGALVEYLVRRWGWKTVWQTYLEMSLQQGESPSAAIERALKARLGLSLAQVEQGFRAELAAAQAEHDYTWDLLTMESYYETVRAYQQRFDPSAYYRTAWMLDGAQMRQRGIVADYFRHPRRPENLALELLLNQAGRARRAGEYARAERSIQAVRRVLERVEAGDPQPFAADPMAADAWEIVQVLIAAGYEPQTWTLGSQEARVLATRGTLNLIEVVLEKRSGRWQLRSGASAAGDDLVQWAE